jgi:hypothetical protein
MENLGGGWSSAYSPGVTSSISCGILRLRPILQQAPILTSLSYDSGLEKQGNTRERVCVWERVRRLQMGVSDKGWKGRKGYIPVLF